MWRRDIVLLLEKHHISAWDVEGVLRFESMIVVIWPQVEGNWGGCQEDVKRMLRECQEECWENVEKNVEKNVERMSKRINSWKILLLLQLLLFVYTKVMILFEQYKWSQWMLVCMCMSIALIIKKVSARASEGEGLAPSIVLRSQLITYWEL